MDVLRSRVSERATTMKLAIKTCCNAISRKIIEMEAPFLKPNRLLTIQLGGFLVKETVDNLINRIHKMKGVVGA